MMWSRMTRLAMKVRRHAALPLHNHPVRLVVQLLLKLPLLLLRTCGGYHNRVLLIVLAMARRT